MGDLNMADIDLTDVAISWSVNDNTGYATHTYTVNPYEYVDACAEEFVEAAGYGISNEEKDPISVVAICIEEGEYDIYELEPVIKEVTGEYLAYYGKDKRRDMVEVE